MSRYFNGQEVELLAPAGNFEIFKEVITSGADAVYLGGKKFNMRMHRKDFNLSNEEIREAIAMAHSLGKKVYITLNNLLSHEDLESVEEYLRFLEEVGPDALIVQDVGVVELIRSLGLKLELHASIMMNVHNLPAIKALRELGVTRIVASREMSLAHIKQLSVQTDMEFEYFVHGDMCIAHGAQCTYSGMIFGQSSNRGLCMKPCRWGFKMKKDNQLYETSFPLAVKDMALYSHMPELIEAGIVSFKIEGRMRDAKYLVNLINEYSDAINRYIEDPLCYDRNKARQVLEENRNRDLSTAYAFGKPGLKNINSRYEGTGKFFSTGKVFSKPIEEIEMSKERIETIKEVLEPKQTVVPEAVARGGIEFAVKVNDYDGALVAIGEGVEHIYLSGETYEPAKPFSLAQIKELTGKKGESKIYLALPRMMYEEDFAKYSHYLKQELGLDGLLVTELGGIYRYKDLGLALVGDFSLNIYNAPMADFYHNQGLVRAALSVESPLGNTKEIIGKSQLPLEVIVSGRPAVMYMEHDLYENTEVLEGKPLPEPSGKEGVLYLIDDKDLEHPVYRDAKGRNHMLLTKELCYIPFMKELYEQGVCHFRIEGCSYDTKELRDMIKLYQKVRSAMLDETVVMPTVEIGSGGYTLGAMQFN